MVKHCRSISLLLGVFLVMAGEVYTQEHPLGEPNPFIDYKSIFISPQEVNSLSDNPLLEAYDVKFYGLDVEADNRSDKISGTCTILVEITESALPALVFDLSSQLNVERVEMDGNDFPFTHQGDEITIPLTEPPDPGVLTTIGIHYHGQTGEGMYTVVDEDWNVPVTFTLSEPFYAKNWFPCKERLDDKADSVHVFITTDYGLTGVSQGIHTGTTYFPNGKVRYEWKSNYLTAFYLISLAVAPYMEYNIEAKPSGLDKPIPIQNFLYDVPGCLDTYREQIDICIPIMELFYDLFGPYPFRDEKYGHYLWPCGGGMEHQTITGIGSFPFHLVAHELGHSWFGDYVTCASWQDIWIAEGFATYSNHLATEYLNPASSRAERDYYFRTALTAREGSVYIPASEVEDDSRIFSYPLSYCKGMALVHMIRFELDNDVLFFEILQRFLQQYGYGSATGLDFKAVLEENSGMDFDDFFNQWYFGEGYPIYTIRWEQQGANLTILSTQTTSSQTTPLFRMPLEFMIRHENGDTLVRVYQENNEETYLIPMPYKVEDVEVDPGNHVLNETAESDPPKMAASKFLTLFPNPNSGQFRFNYKGTVTEDIHIEIYSIRGELEYREVFHGCRPFISHPIEAAGLSGGIHFVRCRAGDHIETLKITVK